jgi:para-nitrobenzyl esterase
MKCLAYLIAVVLALAAVSTVSAALPEEVRIDKGLVAGKPGVGVDVRVFKGIPFAAPPVGQLRWREPQPAAAWEGVRKADQFGPRCLQPDGAASQPMSEDCLYLNIWTAATGADDRRPVIVWSHGGAFTIGAGSQRDGEALAHKGAVLVTYNYRLGPFGFFAHPELTKESGRNASGNYGMMDLIAALQWVHDNIAGFGGDPNCVTIMGQSAGGRLEYDLVASPRAAGLFRRAIAQSAPVRIDALATLTAAERAGVDAAMKLGAHSLPELRAKSAEEIQNGIPGGQPIVDGWCLSEDPSAILAAKRHNDVDLLVGSNKDEGTFSYIRAREYGLGKTTTLEFKAWARERFGPSADAFLQLYPAGSDAEAAVSQLAAFRDEAARNERFWAAAQARRGKGKAYLYYFKHEPPVAAGQQNRGATHGAEVPFAFNNADPLWTDVDRRLADTMSSYWVNFAATGNPNGPGLPSWPAFVVGKNEQRMILGPKVEAGPGLDPARIAVFDALFERVIGKPVDQTAEPRN